MKMPEAQFEIVLFDARDVIATSVGGDDPHSTYIENIWLTPQSINWFNGYNPNVQLEEYDPSKVSNYYAFSGYKHWKYDTYTIVGEAKSLTPEQEIGLRTVNDEKSYLEVLSWLNDYSKRQ